MMGLLVNVLMFLMEALNLILRLSRTRRLG